MSKTVLSSVRMEKMEQMQLPLEDKWREEDTGVSPGN